MGPLPRPTPAQPHGIVLGKLRTDLFEGGAARWTLERRLAGGPVYTRTVPLDGYAAYDADSLRMMANEVVQEKAGFSNMRVSRNAVEGTLLFEFPAANYPAFEAALKPALVASGRGGRDGR